MRRSRALILAAFILAVSPAFAAAQACEPPANGDWLINETIVCSGQSIVLKGSLLVNGSGNLTLSDSSLLFNSSFDGQFGLEANGSLYIIRSVLNTTSDKAYAFASSPGAGLEIRDSFIHNCGFASSDIKKRGVYVGSAWANVTNTTFTDNYDALIVNASNGRFSGNNMASNYLGIAMTNSQNATLAGNAITGNANGLYVEYSRDVLVLGGLCNASGQYDVQTLSSVNVTLDGVNYITMLRRWRLNARVLDDAGDPVPDADVVIINNYGAVVYSGSTDSAGNIPQQLLDERRENQSGVFDYNPYSINVSEPGHYVNRILFNLTGDLSIGVIIVPSVQNPPFSIHISSPENATYTKYNLSAGVMLPLNVSSGSNIISCNYSVWNISGTMEQYAPSSFVASLDTSSMAGGYGITFQCTSPENVTASAGVSFTVYPFYECATPDDCGDAQTCTASRCEDIECECGYAENHECINHECCSDSYCENSEACNLNTHTCGLVPCECPEKRGNHGCAIEPGYCCRDFQCAENNTCDLAKHACVERSLSLIVPGELVFGRNVSINVLDHDGRPVENVRVDVKYPDTDPVVTDTYYTDVNGVAKVEITQSGRVDFVARKGGYFTGNSEGKVPEPFNFVFLAEAVVLVVALAGIGLIAFKMMRGGGVKTAEGGPMKLEKSVSGTTVMLHMRNRTKKKLEGITVRDSVATGAFIQSSLMPKIEPLDDRMSTLTWEILQLGPGEEVTIEYETYHAGEGFSVMYRGKEYRS